MTLTPLTAREKETQEETRSETPEKQARNKNKKESAKEKLLLVLCEVGKLYPRIGLGRTNHTGCSLS